MEKDKGGGVFQGEGPNERIISQISHYALNVYNNNKKVYKEALEYF